MKTHRTSAQLPGRMESHSSHRVRPQLPRSSGALDGRDLERILCDPIHVDDADAHAREETFSLYLAFMRAYGAPRGEFTIMSGNGETGLNGAQRSRSSGLGERGR